MDLITKAIQEVKFRVPRAILKLAYEGPSRWKNAPLGLDEQIRRKTIMARVFVDANIVGGETILVDMEGLEAVKLDEFNYVFHIPPERVNSRTIMTALSVNYLQYNTPANNFVPGVVGSKPVNINDVTNAASKAMASRSSIPITGSADCYVVGHNSVLVRNYLVRSSIKQLKCVVTSDEQLSNISIRSSPDFSKLCELAVKSFVYNELVVALDRGYLERGQELGVIKSKIDEYADAEENYQTFLIENWSVQATINDRLEYESLLSLQIDPSI